jgi:hypothetical protein
MTRCLRVLALCALALGGCQSPRHDAGAGTAMGSRQARYGPACYALYDDAGRPASDSLFGAPAAVRLDTAPIVARPGEPPSYGAVSLDTARRELTHRPPQVFAGGSWSVQGSPDTLLLRYHDGFSGTIFTLVPDDQSGSRLTGYAIESFDAGPRSIRHDGVRAVRASCSSD